ncbi:MAG TPA: ECF transporter S component [Clostridia bacterium]|nr:ECF transporter S component [Clostridia bacterium]
MKTKKLTIIALLIGLSILGSYITIFMSIALDSLPGFFAALSLGALSGGLVGGLGHFMTALIHGFPLGLPTHILVMFMMFLTCYFLGVFYKKSPLVGIIGAFSINWLLTLFLSSLLSYLVGVTPGPLTLFPILLLPLFLGTLMNLLPAVLLHKILGERLNALS